MLTFITHSAEETISLGYKIGQKLKKGDIIAMQGTLAAGKTTITKGIAQALETQHTAVQMIPKKATIKIDLI